MAYFSFPASYANSSFDLIVIECAQLTDNYVKLLHMLKPSGKLHLVSFIGPASSLLQEVKLSGFINQLAQIGIQIIGKSYQNRKQCSFVNFL